MSRIDWAKAPEWAKELAINPHGATAWLGDMSYAYLTAVERLHRWDGPVNIQRDCFKVVESRPAVWDGEGLPPIGAMCEIKLGPQWTKVEVLAYFVGQPVVGWICAEGECVEMRHVSELRPIRTPEQIAAEERESKAKAMWQQIYFNTDPDYWDHAPEGTRDTFRAAIDAGWKKV